MCFCNILLVTTYFLVSFCEFVVNFMEQNAPCHNRLRSLWTSNFAFPCSWQGETWDRRPLGRDLDRNWCHCHTSAKHFWSQPMATWKSATAYECAATQSMGISGSVKEFKSVLLQSMWVCCNSVPSPSCQGPSQNRDSSSLFSLFLKVQFYYFYKHMINCTKKGSVKQMIMRPPMYGEH